MIKKRRFSDNINFGISIWIIPDTYRWFQGSYGIQHIPHITICSKIRHPLNEHIGKSFKFRFEKGFHLFPPTTDNNKTFRAWGWYCKVYELNIQQAHMSTHYFDCTFNNLAIGHLEPPEGVFKGQAYLVDTRSSNPQEWKIINELNPELF